MGKKNLSENDVCWKSVSESEMRIGSENSVRSENLCRVGNVCRIGNKNPNRKQIVSWKKIKLNKIILY